MKRLLSFALLVTASLASASPSDTDAKAVVEKNLLKPLAVKEAKHSRFSRAYQPPVARRVRVLEEKALTDSNGAAFMSFAIDTRGFDDTMLDEIEMPAAPSAEPKKVDEEASWRKNIIVGCVYPETGEVFVKRSEKLFGATLLLGKKTPAAAEHICKAADPQLAAK